ncbi:MAG: hypothetical protein B5M51_07700 [Anaerolinea sp. 4484_236]|nr:MAG: hypothetical protein B5M51_07700 [Anaerolinea sp. 4484_236]
MKTRYFQADTIAEKSREMRDSLASFTRGQTTFIPSRSALLVLDMQRYFLDADSHAHIPSMDAILPNLNRLVAAYAEKNTPIVFTKHLNTKENAGGMSRWWRDLISLDNPLSEIVPELETSKGHLIEKSQYDAFYETDLEEHLREKGVEQVVIGGVMTHLCCETTARSAFMRGFDVFFLIDGAATYNEDFHRATLLNLAHGFARPVLCEEILTATDPHPGPLPEREHPTDMLREEGIPSPFRGEG